MNGTLYQPKRVVLFDPGISTLNRGDEIISDSARHQLEPLIRDAFTIGVSTHIPLSNYSRFFGDVDLQLVLGSNLLRGRMNSLFRQWDVTPLSMHRVGRAVLVGAGWWQYGDELTRYTKWLYHRILSDRWAHSVRDSFTEKMLRSAGFDNVINTGCPSMWSLTPAHCARIPGHRAKRVVFTLTDYNKRPERDVKLVKALISVYDEVYFWPQGLGDLAYFESLDLDSSIRRLPSTLAAYDAYLASEPSTDFVGTRLHGGIRALQHGHRTLILAFDNRALEKSRDFNLPVLHEDDIDSLEDRLTSDWPTEIKIAEESIARWCDQFGIARDV